MPLEGLLDDEEAEVLSNSNNYKPNNAFNQKKIVRRYKSRHAGLDNLNVYMYCANHWKQNRNSDKD